METRASQDRGRWLGRRGVVPCAVLALASGMRGVRAQAAVPVPPAAQPPEAGAGHVTVVAPGNHPSTWAPEEFFTGAVRIDTLFPAVPPSRMSGANVTYEPGARSLWHLHPLGQRLIVTAGVGWVQEAGQPIQEVRTGDVVWIPPNRRHWHGATVDNGMTHIALQEALDGRTTEWLEAVDDADYARGRR